MTDKFIEFINGFNIQTLLSMGIMLWYFTKDINKDIKISIDRLDHDIREMNARVSKLEGTVYGRDLYKSKE